MRMTISYCLQAVRKLRSLWAFKHTYGIVAIAGIALLVLAIPVGSLLSPTREQVEKAFQNDINNIDDGTDFLSLRDRGSNVMALMIFLGCVLIATAVVIFATVQVRAYLSHY